MKSVEQILSEEEKRLKTQIKELQERNRQIANDFPMWID